MPLATLPTSIRTQGNTTYIGPQRGPQEQFLSCTSSIVIYGGAAGGGKSFALLLDALRYAALEPVKGFGAVIFRRTGPQITQEGGLWDESGKLYPLAKGVSNEKRFEWKWAKYKTKIRFSHMQYDADRFSWQGAQIAYIAFDELTHFSQDQFFYLLSRNRSTCGVTPRMRATCNPDADSWVKGFLAPWVDDKWPSADKSKSGEERYFIREDGIVKWLPKGETHPDMKSVTFISANIYDNPILLEINPEYLVNLKSMSLVDRERLLNGNWSIRPEGGKVFQKGWFKPVAIPPSDIVRKIRYWDIAATEDERQAKKNEEKGGPDYTASALVGLTARKTFIVLHATWDRMSPLDVDRFMRNTAIQDGKSVGQRSEQEPGGSGKRDVSHIRRDVLLEFDYQGIPSAGDKVERSRIPSSHVQAGNVDILEGSWNEGFLNFLEAFPNSKVHDDVPDAFSGAMLALIGTGKSAQEYLDYMKQYNSLSGN